MTPLPIVCLNGDFAAAESAKISPLGDGFMFGRGLFETIRVLNGKAVFLQAHLDRISGSASKLGLAWAADLNGLATRIAQVVTRNQLLDGNVKLTIFADLAGVSELILARSFVYPAEKYSSGFRLRVMAGGLADGLPNTHDGGVKTTSYLGNLLARDAAKAAGADDALFVDIAGRVRESATANLFIVREGSVVTPALTSGILPGIARAQILLRFNAPIQEREVTLDEVKGADEVFVTNALLGVMPVASIDEKKYSLDSYKVTPALRVEFRRWQQDSIGGL